MFLFKFYQNKVKRARAREFNSVSFCCCHLHLFLDIELSFPFVTKMELQQMIKSVRDSPDITTSSSGRRKQPNAVSKTHLNSEPNIRTERAERTDESSGAYFDSNDLKLVSQSSLTAEWYSSIK